MAFRRGIYIVPTHRWYIERTVWLIAGGVLLTSTTLAALVHPLWILLVIATAWASIAVSLTGFCIVGNLLQRLGFTAMLGQDLSDFAGVAVGRSVQDQDVGHERQSNGSL